MKLRTVAVSVLASFLAPAAASAQTQPVPAIPHLEQRGVATQLIVDGKPYLILGGEVANTASSNLDSMKPVWPRLAEMNLSTVLVAVAWAWSEPAEGKYDFTLVDGLLDVASRQSIGV
jgi:hypothetical protein